ncbi:cygnin [Columba livia]|uniref:cygnin n=1 Tax=Columba livia TaxID=8932 RepID=UPI00032D5014|nr:cygnin-like [Columba livia]KAK2511751.1 hypothetical protein Q9233_016755 [Columba guinea]KAK2533996.1 hypothetical protein Q9966_007420 [Columba livia]
MRFLYLVFAVFLLVSLATPGYGQVKKYWTYCPKEGHCSSKCDKMYTWTTSSDCKFYCCIPYSWNGK